MKQYEETEQLAVDEKKKSLHYERIRIQEIKLEISKNLAEVEEKDREIDDKVFEDTKPQQAEKHRIGNEIDELGKQIEKLERELDRVTRQRNQLIQEQQTY